MGFDIFAPKAPPVIGVDISASSIKMVELTEDKKGLRLERYAVEPVSDHMIVDGEVVDPDALSEALLSCHKRLGSKIKGVAAALPSSMVIMKTLYVNAGMPEIDIEEQVSDELSNHIASAISESSIDFQLKPMEEGRDDQPVVAAAAIRKRVEDRANAIDAAGLKPIIVDSELLALIDAVERYLDRVGLERKGKSILVSDIGSNVTHFTFLRDGEVVYTREHSFGGHQLTRDVQDRFGCSIEEARRIKMGIKETEQEGIVREMQSAFADGAAQEVKRAIQLYTTSTNHATVDIILLCGGSAQIPGLEEFVTSVVGTEARILNPFEGMAIGQFVDQVRLNRECASLVVACGLAMRRFDK